MRTTERRVSSQAPVAEMLVHRFQPQLPQITHWLQSTRNRTPLRAHTHRVHRPCPRLGIDEGNDPE
eukprot:15449059-Alexandrium_andersonii.AAC.1